jgi:peptide/nickel transport system ATP-binding protein
VSARRTRSPATDRPDRPEVVLRAQSLSKVFRLRGSFGGRQAVQAVSEVSLELRRGSVLALVGESGCGKSTVARLLARLYPLSSGTMWLDGEQVARRGGRARRKYAAQVQIVLQDPFSSLNAAHSIRHHLVRPLLLHRRGRPDTGNLDQAAVRLLEEVNLTPGADFLRRYPHELSGGQRQRVSIARALAVEPEVLLADEPVSMLDVSIRLEILRLLGRLVADRNLAMLYITHDIASARYFATETAVMYAGELVEQGPSEQVTQDPKHPYTQLLLASVPDPDRAARGDTGRTAPGEPPDLAALPDGCRFHPRCPFAGERCRTESPPAVDAGDAHWVRCWLFAPGGVSGESPPITADQPE